MTTHRLNSLSVTVAPSHHPGHLTVEFFTPSGDRLATRRILSESLDAILLSRTDSEAFATAARVAR